MTPTEFIERLTRIYGAPYKDPSGELASILVQQLKRFEPEVLEKASEQIILTREHRTWPMPVEVVAHCRNAAATLTPVKPRRTQEDYWSTERIVHADNAVLCDLGAEAADQGWLEELWNFCRRTYRMPDIHEVKKLMADAEVNMRKRDAQFAKISNDEGWGPKSHPIRTALLQLYEKMQKHAGWREERVLAWKQQRAA